VVGSVRTEDGYGAGGMRRGRTPENHHDRALLAGNV